MKEIRNLVDLIKQVYEILDKRDKKYCIVVFINILFSAVLETLSISVVVPFIMAIMTPDLLKSNKYVSILCGVLKINTNEKLLISMGIVLIAIFILKNLYLVFSSYLQIKFRYSIQEKLSVRMLSSYLKRPYTYFINVNSSEIIRGLGSDVGCVKDFIETAFSFLTQVITMIMISIYLIITDAILAIGILGTSLICVFVITYVFKSRVKQLGTAQRAANALVNKYSYEAITGVKEIIVMQRQKRFVNLYKNAYTKTKNVNISYATIAACPSRVIESVFILGLIAIVCIRISMGLDAEVFVPQLAAFAVGGMKMLPSMSAISGAITAMIFQKPGVNATYSNLKEVERYELEKRSMQVENNYSKERENNKFSQITIKDICWSYEKSKKTILNNLSLTINQGESIAFIGESGAGKTTLVDIILGLFVPQKGEILLDGVNIHSIEEEWSKKVAYVQQSVFLLDDTIKHNIAFGIPDEEINEEDVWNALEQAQLKEYILSKPEGIDTIVGERGVKFSGGQRQRIAIARALYNDPEILILDEATAALDNETEEAVLEAIEMLQGKKTLIIVAHRLTTIRNCNKIYEIKEGKAYLRNKMDIIK